MPGLLVLSSTKRPQDLPPVLLGVFVWRPVYVHDCCLIFALPPAALGVHPSETPAHELSIMCDDLQATIAELAAKGVEFEGTPEAGGFGTFVTMVLPGGVRMLLYEPRHATAI